MSPWSCVSSWLCWPLTRRTRLCNGQKQRNEQTCAKKISVAEFFCNWELRHSSSFEAGVWLAHQTPALLTEEQCSAQQSFPPQLSSTNKKQDLRSIFVRFRWLIPLIDKLWLTSVVYFCSDQENPPIFWLEPLLSALDPILQCDTSSKAQQSRSNLIYLVFEEEKHNGSG